MAALLTGIGVARPPWRFALPPLYLAALVLFPFGRMEQVYLPQSIAHWNPGATAAYRGMPACRTGRGVL